MYQSIPIFVILLLWEQSAANRFKFIEISTRFLFHLLKDERLKYCECFIPLNFNFVAGLLIFTNLLQAPKFFRCLISVLVIFYCVCSITYIIIINNNTICSIHHFFSSVSFAMLFYFSFYPIFTRHTHNFWFDIYIFIYITVPVGYKKIWCSPYKCIPILSESSVIRYFPWRKWIWRSGIRIFFAFYRFH